MVSEIRRYVRNKKGHPVGMLLAIKDEKGVHIGWSKCNTRLDIFDRKKGAVIAQARALKGSIVPYPREIEKSIYDFMNRAEKYFKAKVHHDTGACRHDSVGQNNV